ncbi:MAG TPA: S8 family serine peptidase, partial [Candidatus Thalassarchaeaceae archaeon]|nr:S8 family serine peptidase [Candidatus Thalassarchaeaceae archaeon]
GHGTHCAGITAGTGAPDMVHVGVAPQAQLVGVKVLDSGGSGSFSTVMAGMEWTVDKKHVFNIRAASMSLGGPGAIEWTSSEEESVNRMGNRMMAEGIALFIAAGNNAVSAQIGTPGSAEDVITVGALDKSGSIAVYSSQGPTEEGRIKPNIAFIGSNVNAPDYNTGTGYVSLSGTSMATPGAAGLAALMYQANPDMSPFDVRNIMQETAIYRPCHYDFANEPCAEDLIPKNRQNNVYGHGETRAPESVAEAANYVFGLDMGMNISLQYEPTMDDKVHVGPGEGIDYSLTGDPVEVQWRTWDMRDTWMDLVEHDMGEEEVTITHTMLVDRLNELPDVEIEGNHTILLRSIRGPNASANMVTHIHVMGSEPLIDVEGGSGQGMVAALSFVVLLLAGVIGLLMFILYRNSTLDSNHRIGDFSAKVQDSSSHDANLLDTFQTKLNNSQTGSVADYASMTVAELKDVLKSKGLPFSGRKAELIERLTNEK